MGLYCNASSNRTAFSHKVASISEIGGGSEAGILGTKCCGSLDVILEAQSALRSTHQPPGLSELFKTT